MIALVELHPAECFLKMKQTLRVQCAHICRASMAAALGPLAEGFYHGTWSLRECLWIPQIRVKAASETNVGTTVGGSQEEAIKSTPSKYGLNSP